jgi:hypothetical protein
MAAATPAARLPVSIRTSTNMPTAEATIAPSSSRLCTSIGGTPAQSSGAPTAASTTMASE